MKLTVIIIVQSIITVVVSNNPDKLFWDFATSISGFI